MVKLVRSTIFFFSTRFPHSKTKLESLLCHIYFLYKNILLFGHISLKCVTRMQDEKAHMKWFKRYCSDSRFLCFIRKNTPGELLEQEDKGETTVVLSCVYKPGPNSSLAMRLLRQGWKFATSNRNKIASFDFLARCMHPTLWNPTQMNEKLWIYCHLIIASCSVRSEAFSSLSSLSSTTNSH